MIGIENTFDLQLQLVLPALGPIMHHLPDVCDLRG